MTLGWFLMVSSLLALTALSTLHVPRLSASIGDTLATVVVAILVLLPALLLIDPAPELRVTQEGPMMRPPQPGAMAESLLPTNTLDVIEPQPATGNDGNWRRWIGGLLILGAFWRLGKLVNGLRQARRMAIEGDPFAGASGDIQWRLHAGCDSPFLWPGRENIIIAPATAGDWPLDWRSQVESHELAHQGRRDQWRVLLGQFAAALYWYNPFVSKLVSRHRLEMEIACDQDCVQVANPAEYARMLVSLSSRRHTGAFAAMGCRRELPMRIDALLKPAIRAGRAESIVWSAGLVAVLSAIALLASQVVLSGYSTEATSQFVQPLGESLSSHRYLGIQPGRMQVAAFYDGQSVPDGGLSVELYSPSRNRRAWIRFNGLLKFHEELLTWEGLLKGDARPTGRVRVSGLVKDGVVDGVAYGINWRDADGNFRFFRSTSITPTEMPNVVCAWPLAMNEPQWIARTPDLEGWARESAKRLLCGAQLVGNGEYAGSRP